MVLRNIPDLWLQCGSTVAFLQRLHAVFQGSQRLQSTLLLPDLPRLLRPSLGRSSRLPGAAGHVGSVIPFWRDKTEEKPW